MSELNKYQEYAKQFAKYPDAGTHSQTEVMYLTLGLAGETGEVAEKIKKYYRDGTVLDKADLAKELGDVLWYLSQIALWADLKLHYVADLNLAKLYSRKDRGVLGGSGDNR